VAQKLLIDMVGYTAAVIGIAMFVPQAVQMWRTKETKAVSLMTFLLTNIASLLWLTYGFLTNAKPVILVNSVAALLSFSIIYMKLRYKDKKIS